MLQPGEKLGVAVSGGADSVVLLHVLHRLFRYDLMVLHVNHMLRGAESDADELFVRDLAQSFELPVEVKRIPVGAGNLEQEARNIRRLFFAECRVARGLCLVALGHNRTDQAETVLYRFLRGSGLAGLAGMRPLTADGLIRPLLEVTREEIRDWARQEGVAWREDSSNRDTSFIRNRLRLETINPRLVQVLSAAAEVAQDEEDWWAARTRAQYEGIVRQGSFGPEIAATELRQLHPAEQRRLIRHGIREVKGDLRSIDLAHVEAIRKLTASEAGHDRVLAPGIDALRSFGTLLLTKPGKLAKVVRHYRIGVEIGVETALPQGAGRLYVKRVKPDEPIYGNFGLEGLDNQEVADLDAEAAGQAGPDLWQVRNWEPGDEYRRLGHKNAEKIKSLFQQERVLLWRRRHWPVLLRGNEILWSRQFGPAAEFQATDESREILRIVYTPAD